LVEFPIGRIEGRTEGTKASSAYTTSIHVSAKQNKSSRFL